MTNVTVPSNLKTISLPITSRDLVGYPLTHSEMVAMLAAYANAATDPVTVSFATGLFQYLTNRFAVTTEISYKVGHPEKVLVDEYGNADPIVTDKI